MDKLYDVIVIGAGPAGMTAAIYAKRACLDTLVLEKEYMGGGQVLNTYEVENYPGFCGISGFDLGMKFKEHADQLGVSFVTESVKGIERDSTIIKVKTGKNVYRTRTAILATGAGHRKLMIPGEEMYAGRGMSYCATCDGAFYRGKTTAVVGGGDAAVEDAIFLARMCEKVYVVHRREELRAVKSLQRKLFELPNVEMVWNCVADRIGGDEMVRHLAVRNEKSGEKRLLSVDGVFAAIGSTPNSRMFEGFVEMDAGGYVIADESCRTSVPGVFAAGDLRTKTVRQIITAASDGANAIYQAEQFLNDIEA